MDDTQKNDIKDKIPEPQFSDPVKDDIAERKAERDNESQLEKVKYPKQIAFIVGNEFCERFSFYGMKAILVLYLTGQLNFSEDDSTIIYHTFVMFCYFTPILGAIIADSWLGRFNTIFYISILYATGNVLLSVGATGQIGGEIVFAMVGLALIAFGTGGIKPCVSAFGGDQFVLPQQQKQLVQFFSLFYFAINAGSMVSTLITPILRADVSCFDADTCFFAAFGIPAILFIVAIILFVIGKGMYRVVPPTGENLLVKVVKCIFHALVTKSRQKKIVKKEHWMDYAAESYGKTFCEDVKAVLRVLFLYIPLPVFWTLFDQTGSRWTFQCTRMDGQIGSFIIKPDQMQAVNPILILVFIPIFDRIIYPLFEKCNLLTKPLTRMTWGGILAGVAFAISGILELFLEDTYAILPVDGASHLSVINGVGCGLQFNVDTKSPEPLEVNMDMFDEKPILNMIAGHEQTLKFTTVGDCKADYEPTSTSVSLKFTSKINTAHSVFVFVDPETRELKVVELNNDDKEKDGQGDAKTRIIYNLPKGLVEKCPKISANRIDSDDVSEFKLNADEPVDDTAYDIVEPYEYQISICEAEEKIVAEKRKTFRLGGVYNILVQQPYGVTDRLDIEQFVMTKPNEMSMLLIIPQYVVLTAGEIMYSITGLEFSFSQAPASMKSILQAAWLLTVAFGNLIVIIIGTANFFDSQAYEFFLFAGLMLVDMMLFMVMAYFYTPYVPVHDDDQGSTASQEIEDRLRSDSHFSRRSSRVSAIM